MVQLSPWPLTVSIGAFALVVGFVKWFHGEGMLIIFLSLFIIVLSLISW